MITPKFNNKPNDHIMYGFDSQSSGVKIRQDYWISRSVTTVGIVFIISSHDDIQILITQRSNKMRDEKNKYCLPCGYVDWQETIFESMTREVYEETSLYLPDYKDLLITNYNEKPIEIRDNPNNHLQNISFIYLSVYDFTKNMQRFPIDIEKYSDKETKLVKWISFNDLYDKYDKELNWAFNHNETIKKAIEFYKHNIK